MESINKLNAIEFISSLMSHCNTDEQIEYLEFAKREIQKGIVLKFCEHCGKQFELTHGKKKYCPNCDRRTVFSKKQKQKIKGN